MAQSIAQNCRDFVGDKLHDIFPLTSLFLSRWTCKNLICPLLNVGDKDFFEHREINVHMSSKGYSIPNSNIFMILRITQSPVCSDS